jgi:hypothetical protein
MSRGTAQATGTAAGRGNATMSLQCLNSRDDGIQKLSERVDGCFGGFRCHDDGRRQMSILVYCSNAVLPEQGVGWQFEKDITRTMIVVVENSRVVKQAR